MRPSKPDQPKQSTAQRIVIPTEQIPVANYLIRGFHDWASRGRYYIEPGFRHLINQPIKEITIHYLGIRDDWEPLCQKAFKEWEHALCSLNIKFKKVKDPKLADIVIDDEKNGAFAQRQFQYIGRSIIQGQKTLPIFHTVAREINISKLWPEWNAYDAIIHEIGHVLGAGHPGAYNGSKPKKHPQGWENIDTSENTIMSYYGPPTGKVGPIDIFAMEKLYFGEEDK